MDKIDKILDFDIKQVGEEEDRVLRFCGSDETPDRDNDIMEVGGWKLDEYIKNPVFLWAHSYHELPVGKAINVMIDAAARKLIFDIKFPTAEEYPFADTVYKLYKGGYLKATSVGFQGVKYKTRDEPERLELPEWRRGRRYMEQKLLELSAVPVPANPNALMMAKSAGIETDEVEKMLVTKDFEIDRENRVVKVYQDEDVFAVTFDFINSLDPEAIKEFTEWKSGAALSGKNKKMLDEIHKQLAGCGDTLRKFIDSAGMMEDEEDPEEMPMKTVDINQIKQALEDIKSQVLLLSPKTDASKDINLDAIEWPKNEKNAAKDELQIEPGELTKLISDTIQNQLTNGGISI